MSDAEEMVFSSLVRRFQVQSNKNKNQKNPQCRIAAFEILYIILFVVTDKRALGSLRRCVIFIFVGSSGVMLDGANEPINIVINKYIYSRASDE